MREFAELYSQFRGVMAGYLPCIASGVGMNGIKRNPDAFLRELEFYESRWKKYQTIMPENMRKELDYVGRTLRERLSEPITESGPVHFQEVLMLKPGDKQ
jgi:hypothetical protein